MKAREGGSGSIEERAGRKRRGTCQTTTARLKMMGDRVPQILDENGSFGHINTHFNHGKRVVLTENGIAGPPLLPCEIML